MNRCIPVFCILLTMKIDIHTIRLSTYPPLEERLLVIITICYAFYFTSHTCCASGACLDRPFVRQFVNARVPDSQILFAWKLN